MSRIISGTAKGMSLKVPSSARPTTDRVREALMTILDHRGYVVDNRILDLFAGSGAFALEALSRGAAGAVAVDLSREATSLMKDNAKKTGLGLEIVCAKAESWVNGVDDPFDLIFLDPPYHYPDDKLEGILVKCSGVLVDDGLFVVERDKRDREPSWPAGFQTDFVRTWGDTAVWSACRTGNQLG